MTAERTVRSRVRGWWRAAVLAAALCECVIRFFLLRTATAGVRGRLSARQRADWLHRSCQLVRRRLGFSVRLVGDPPSSGLLASNHLSYLDILFYGAALPCVFVAKQEVRGWPMLGLLAALGGTVFIDRRSAAGAAAAAARVEQLLAAGVMVLVFPEGTSSDGTRVSRFYPSLFEPAVRAAAPVWAAAIGYSAGGDAAEGDLCYYGDISFAPHLLKTLELPGLAATLRFAPSGEVYRDRKLAARQAWQLVAGLRSYQGASGAVVGESPESGFGVPNSFGVPDS